MFCLFLLLSIFTTDLYAHYKPSPEIVEITFERGRNWNKNLSFKKQKDIGEHVVFFKKLYHQGKVLVASFEKGDHFGKYWIKSKNHKEVDELLKENPAISSGILDYKLKSITVTMIGGLDEIRKHEH